jgi:hypothetical protein
MGPGAIDIWECVESTVLDELEPLGPPFADVLRAVEALTAEVASVLVQVLTNAVGPIAGR